MIGATDNHSNDILTEDNVEHACPSLLQAI